MSNSTQDRLICNDHRKGFIVVNDSDSAIPDIVKQELRFDELKSSHKIKELTIDESWSLYMENDAKELWNRLVKTTNSVRDGLLVLNISNIEFFRHCDYILQLVKQEKELFALCKDEIFDMENGFLNIPKMQEKTNLMKSQGKSKEEILAYVDETLKESVARKLKPSRVDFKGFVLLNIQGISWVEVEQYAKLHNSGEFDAMMEFFHLFSSLPDKERA